MKRDERRRFIRIQTILIALTLLAKMRMRRRVGKRRVKYPRYNDTSPSDLKARMTFTDKKQLKEVVDTYKILEDII